MESRLTQRMRDSSGRKIKGSVKGVVGCRTVPLLLCYRSVPLNLVALIRRCSFIMGHLEYVPKCAKGG